MNKLITKFGHIVGQNVEDKPQKAFSLLKAAYMLSGWQIKFMPNKKLLPSEKYMALLCNQAIQQPLRHPERSAIVNLFLPCNVLHAMDIAPQFTEGLHFLNGAAVTMHLMIMRKLGVPQS
jgi:hypothetical protein